MKLGQGVIQMNYADIKVVDVANGEGVRVSVFVSGCNHHCKNCFNQEAWDFNYGKPFTQENIDKVMSELDKPYIKGLSLLGGEPLEPKNQEGLMPLLRQAKAKHPEKDIWCYTGFTFDRDVINNMCKNNETTKEFMSYVDVMVDGKFEEDKKDLKLKFRGSSNQRIIDVKKSIETKQVVEKEV